MTEASDQPPYPNPVTAAQVAANRAWFDASVAAGQRQQAQDVVTVMQGGTATAHPDVYQLPDIQVRTPPWGLIVAALALYALAFMGDGGSRDY